MEITKPNDIFVATFNNPKATTYDLMSMGVTPENTSLFKKEEYEKSPFVQDRFKTESGEFDSVSFNEFYKLAQINYQTLTDEDYLEKLDTIMYSPFDVTRPKEAKTFNINVTFEKDYNPYKDLYSRTGINSVTPGHLSLRELAQTEKIFDTKSNTWLEDSVNDRSLINKLFGETLVYAQYDTDGTHTDPFSNRIVKHKKGDWKINENGNLYVETLGDREIYGKQIVNPMDSLTTDGSFANKLDIFDSDNRESNALKTTLKIAVEIAPLFIPGVNVYYGGIKAAIGLSSALPTLYKSFEGILLGDNVSSLNNLATAAEGYLSKFSASSVSDESQSSLVNYEQIATMTSDIFSQIFEQRAAASLSKYFFKPSTALKKSQEEIIEKINGNLYKSVIEGKIKTKEELQKLQQIALSKVPGLKELSESQSKVSKMLSLGYMAVTSTADVYGQSIQAGYDRRTSGFAGLLSATGTYALMMNNRMGDWFLDKTTGYTTQTNKALVNKTISEYLKPIDDAFKLIDKSSAEGKKRLAFTVKNIKNKLNDTFNNPSIIGEALWKNSFIEGIEEVSEEAVIDSTKGIIDVFSSLGLTKKKGSFGGISNVFSAQGIERYLASLFGGVIGGSMFEFHRTKIEPWISGEQLSFDTKNEIYNLVGNGQADLLVDQINKQRNKLGNSFINPYNVEGEVSVAETGKTHADLVADTAIGMIRNIEGLMNANDLVKTDDEIIKKAISDYVVIKDLIGSKDENNIGIEGLIVDDFRDNAKKLSNINLEIQKLLSDEDKNKEELTRLKSEAKIYKKNIDDILGGKKSMDYFESALFYLSKQLSEDWITIDRVNFVKTKYGKDYYNLPEKGSGITKERIETEWKEFLEPTNIRQKILIATKAFLELEKDMANSTSKYVDSGYSEERKKTLKHLLDIDFTGLLFSSTTPEEDANKLSKYIERARFIESTIGRRIVPWDAMSIDIFDTLLERKLFTFNVDGLPVSKDYLQEEIHLDDHVTKREDLIKEMLSTAVKNSPSEAFLYPMIAGMVNNQINKYNLNIDKQIDEINSQITDENREQSEMRMNELDKNKLYVSLNEKGDENFVNMSKYAIKAIINEIKSNNNLDKELLLKIKEQYHNVIFEIKNKYFKEIFISDENIIDFITNVEEIYLKLRYLNDDIPLSSPLPDYLNTIIKNDPDKDSFTSISYTLEKIAGDINNDLTFLKDTISDLKELQEVIEKEDEFISNSIYDFLQNFELTLNDKEKLRKKSIFSILKSEEYKLLTVSDITNYIQENIEEVDLVQAINTIKLLKSLINSLKTTTIDDTYGFVEYRKKFAEKNKLDSDVLKINTISSDIAELSTLDLTRIQNKLEFLIQLSKNNSGKIFKEQEEIRLRTNELLLNNWKDLIKNNSDLNYLNEIINNPSYTLEKKLLEIESKFFEENLKKSDEDKKLFINNLLKSYNFSNALENLYEKDGKNRIEKEVQGLSNNDFVLYLVSNLVLNSKDFSNKLRNILKSDFDKSPFFTQELAVRIAYASIINPDLFSEVVKQTKHELTHLTDNITYVLGDAGTGKTSVIFKMLTLLLKENNPNLSIWFSGPNLNKAIELHDNVLSNINYSKFNNLQKLDKISLFEKVGISQIIKDIKDNKPDVVNIEETRAEFGNDIFVKINFDNIVFDIKTDLPDLIFIDEVTHFEAWELEVLNKLVDVLRSNGKNIRIITAGDHTQLGSQLESHKISYNVDRVSGIFTPQLTLSIRSANSQKRENLDILSTVVKRAVSVYETRKDIPKITELIRDGILLKHHISKDKINGEILLDNSTIPLNILKTLSNIIINKPSTKIGILSDTLEIDPAIKNQLESVGITNNNYVIYTKDTIQGSEEDYFIIKLSDMSGTNILHGLRKLYTYNSRSKSGTIIINDTENKNIINNDDSVILLKQESQDYSTEVQPLSDDVIKDNKNDREKILTDILNPNFTVKYDDFKFDSKLINFEDTTLDDNTVTFDQPDKEDNNSTFIIKDDFKYRIHTFYNDLNSKYINGVVEGNKDSNFSYGLDFLDGKELTASEYENYVDDLVRLKYEILNSLYKGNLEIPRKNFILGEVFGDSMYGSKKLPISYSLVFKKSNYSELYNFPYNKKGNVEELHLKTQDKYLNLFVKIKSNNTGKEYNIQLGTFPKLETVQEWFGKNSNSFEKYKDFIKNGDDEIEIDPNKIEVRTSTRLLKFKDNPNWTLKELGTNFRGLTFWDSNWYKSNKPVVRLFPNTFEEFKKLYEKTTFGTKLEDTEISNLFYGKFDKDGNRLSPGYKGKPYVAVSFINDISQVQFLLLKSKTRSIEEIDKIIKESPKNEEFETLRDTLFSGNQVLNMLISLAVKKPDLFNKFFETGSKVLEETKKSITPENQEFYTKYLSSIDNIMSEDLLFFITKSTKSENNKLRQVFNLIQSEINKYKQSGKSINEKKLKNDILNIVKTKVVWWSKFWRVFDFKNTAEFISKYENAKVLDEVKDLYTNFNDNLNDILSFWKSEFDNKFYYNVPLEPIIGGFYKLKDIEYNNDNLYVSLTPESPYLNIDFEDIVNFNKTKISQKEVSEIDKLKDKLSKIKYNNTEIINSDNSDTEEILNNKIKRSLLIKDILNHKNNTYALSELLLINNLDEILVSLNFEIKPNNIESVVKQLQELSRVDSDKSNLIRSFESVINYIKDSDNQDDKDIINEIISKWNNRNFSEQKTLFEFLQSLPETNDEILPFIDNTGFIDDPEYIGSILTREIYEKLKINIDGKDMDFTENLFKECNIE